MTTITITECKTNGRTWTSTHRTDDAIVAMERAVRRVWGKSASLFCDNGISVGRTPAEGTQYGQIVTPARGNPGASNCITGRVSVRAD